MMTLGFSSDAVLGYCTNVHAGVTLEQIKGHLERYAVAVRKLVSPQAPMGLGLWFPYSAAVQLTETEGVRALRDWLGERGLFVFTLNGFPFGDFHRDVVKHAVYQPHWADPRRLDYTRRLAVILAGLLPDELNEGSISTLPIGWPTSFRPPEDVDAQANAAAAQLTELVHHLARLEMDTGKYIHLALEPEPGCVLDTAPAVVRFFEDHLLGTPDEVSVRGYLGVCHDVCHSAVMFEPQADAWETYRRGGLRIGKVQLSNALEVDFGSLDKTQADDALEALRHFTDPRYLHQTHVRSAQGDTTFFHDLPNALAAYSFAGSPSSDGWGGRWRVHFHVPLHHAQLGPLGTTQADLIELLALAKASGGVTHFEAETYAWDVLPAGFGTDDLAAGIADELRWVKQSAIAQGSAT